MNLFPILRPSATDRRSGEWCIATSRTDDPSRSEHDQPLDTAIAEEAAAAVAVCGRATGFDRVDHGAPVVDKGRRDR
jgi:hypothetical protein